MPITMRDASYVAFSIRHAAWLPRFVFDALRCAFDAAAMLDDAATP